jgi:putative transposase
MDIESNPKTAVSNLVGKLKGKSSYILRNEFWSEIKNKLWGDHFWSPSYCVVSCGGASLDVVRAYIEDQRKPSDKKSMEQSKRFAGTNRNQDKTWNRKTR